MPDYIWNATPGPIQDASVGSNWLPPGPPSAADNAVFNNPTAAACNFDITAVNEIRIDAEFDVSSLETTSLLPVFLRQLME
jgi:hypothetical protein